MKKVYKKKNKSLEKCIEEGGTRGEILQLRKERCIVSQRGYDLAQ